MEALINKARLKKLTPVLSKKEKEEMLAYYTVYEKYSKEISTKAIEDLKDHSIFGKLIADIPKEVSAVNEKISRELQKDAIINENWQRYIEYQIEQGAIYAKMGLDFISWYEVVALAKNYISPYLYKEYGSGEELFSSLSGMNRFMDIAMGIIGEAYMYAKEEIIQQDGEKIKKLNEELEQKVFERTAQLQKSNNLFSDLFNHNPAALTINREEDGKIMNCNNAFLDLFEFSTKEEIIGKTSTELDLQTNPNQVDETFRLMKEKEFVKDREICIRNKQGNLIWVSSSIVKVNIDNTPGFLTVSIDISERKKAEEQLVAVNKELEAFSYSVSHDLRAPLRAVNGYGEMLNEDYGTKLDEEGKRIIQAIRYNTTKMGTLIDDLLAFSQLGRKEMKKTKIDMNEMTEGVLIEMNKSVSHKAKIRIGELQSVKADYGLLHQVMFNLISNAVKYSSKKENPVVEIFSEERNGEIIFSVKDNGAGFDMKYADKLFGVFQRLHSQDEFEGTGVGLAIVQRVIAKHEGRVWAEGKVNEGATFNFSLTIN